MDIHGYLGILIHRYPWISIHRHSYPGKSMDGYGSKESRFDGLNIHHGYPKTASEGYKLEPINSSLNSLASLVLLRRRDPHANQFIHRWWPMRLRKPEEANAMRLQLTTTNDLFDFLFERPLGSLISWSSQRRKNLIG